MADTLRVSFDNPQFALRYGPGEQRFRIRARKSGTGGDPTLKVELYEGPALLATPIPPTPVSSASGTTLEGTWDAQGLQNRFGESVEALVTVERGVGGAALDLSALPWIAHELTEATTLVSDDLRLQWNLSSSAGDALSLRWNVLSFIAPPAQRVLAGSSPSRVLAARGGEERRLGGSQRSRILTASGSSRVL